MKVWVRIEVMFECSIKSLFSIPVFPQTILCLFVVFVCALAAPKPQFFTTELLDSAYTRNERIGGNFAYSSVEGPAFKAYAPYYRNYVRPATYYDSNPSFYQYAPEYYYGGLNYRYL